MDTIKVLGVTLTHDLCMSKHIDAVVNSCGQTTFALKMLRAHGLAERSHKAIVWSVAVSKLQYASTAWSGFAKASDRDRVRAFLRRSVRAGFYGADAPTFDELCAVSDRNFFRSAISNPNHVLRSLLPLVVQCNYSLRKRPHNFMLPQRGSRLSDSNFLF